MASPLPNTSIPVPQTESLQISTQHSSTQNQLPTQNPSATQTQSIIDTIAIETILKHREPLSNQPFTWFVFDIDNVLAKTINQIGSDQWFRWRCGDAKKKGEPFEKALNEWTALQLLVDVEPVEEKTVAVVKQLQDEKFKTFAITSRGMRLGDRTVEQLKSIGIDFTVNSLKEEEIFWPRGLTERIQEHVLYEKGILFTAGQNKGIGLTKLLEHVTDRPTRIVYIDDSRQHVENVAAACNKLGIECIGYHYRKLDLWVSEFDPKLAEEMLCALKMTTGTIQNEDLTSGFCAPSQKQNNSNTESTSAESTNAGSKKLRLF